MYTVLTFEMPFDMSCGFVAVSGTVPLSFMTMQNLTAAHEVQPIPAPFVKRM